MPYLGELLRERTFGGVWATWHEPGCATEFIPLVVARAPPGASYYNTRAPHPAAGPYRATAIATFRYPDSGIPISTG